MIVKILKLEKIGLTLILLSYALSAFSLTQKDGLDFKNTESVVSKKIIKIESTSRKKVSKEILQLKPKKTKDSKPIESKSDYKEKITKSKLPLNKRAMVSYNILDLRKMFNRFWLADSVSMDLQKEVESGLLGVQAVHKGRFYFSKGKIRVEFFEPQKSLLIVDNDNIWHSIKAPEALGGKWQVTKVKKSMTSKSQAFLNLMFGDELYWHKLKVIQLKVIDNKIEYMFKPEKENDFPNLKKLVIVMSEDKKELQNITQWDYIENKINYSFSNHDSSKVLPKKMFKFKLPKGASINEF